jgi:KipI family sensor histidine kinase inhibitor
VKWRAYGPKAVLIELSPDSGSGGSQVRAVAQALEAAAPEEVAEWTFAFETVLVEFRTAGNVAERAEKLLEWFASLQPMTGEDAPLVEIPVVYDGEDLEVIARGSGLPIAEVVERYRAPIYEVAMLGFSPGFPYLRGLDARLATPRRSTPRASIRAGSVAIGGIHTGIYSVASPGGWNVIGHTSVRVFDPGRRDADGGEAGMFLLRAGDRVRFVEG